jgi:RNA polymerase sigma-70 factor (ECF subfamily)
MSSTESPAELVTGLQFGNAEVARQLVVRFYDRLIAFARCNLDGRLHSKLDPEDVVISVYRSFWVRYAGGDHHFQSWSGVWRLLCQIAINKCRRNGRKYRGPKSDIKLGVPLQCSEESGSGPEPLSREPTVTEKLELEELVNELLDDQPAKNRPILALILEGRLSPTEIANETGRSQRSVYRLKERLEEELNERLGKKPKGGKRLVDDTHASVRAWPAPSLSPVAPSVPPISGVASPTSVHQGRE